MELWVSLLSAWGLDQKACNGPIQLKRFYDSIRKELCEPINRKITFHEIIYCTSLVILLLTVCFRSAPLPEHLSCKSETKEVIFGKFTQYYPELYL